MNKEIASKALRTALFSEHKALGGHMVPFAGWEMPLHYGSQLEEHHAVRNSAGMFDVSHMQVVDLFSDRSHEFLQRLLANDVAKLTQEGCALYSCMLNEQGGVMDDLLVYYMAQGWYRLVVNAGTADKDLAWIKQQASAFSVRVKARDDVAMIAVQGPEARVRVLMQLGSKMQSQADQLPRFSAVEHNDWMVARTGYTGEDGFEVVLPATQAVAFWQRLYQDGVIPCGLGARDTLRLEAGMNLYGSDMDEKTTPLESGLSWTVAWEPRKRHFIGRKALEAKRDNKDNPKFVGLVLKGRGVLRNHQKLFVNDSEAGEITSGGFAPTLGKSIALARVRSDVGNECEVEIRGRRLPVAVVRPPFVRSGRVCIKIDE